MKKIAMLFSNSKNVSAWVVGMLSLSCIIITIVRSIIITWGSVYLAEFGYNVPEITNYTFSSNLALLLGILSAGLCSDKFFNSERWNINILFQIGTFLIILSFCVITPNIIVACYPFLLLGTCFFTFGAQALIFVTAIEVVNKNNRGVIVALIMLTSYTSKAFSHILIGWGVQLIGWKYIYTALCLCTSLIILSFYFAKIRLTDS